MTRNMRTHAARAFCCVYTLTQTSHNTHIYTHTTHTHTHIHIHIHACALHTHVHTAHHSITLGCVFDASHRSCCVVIDTVFTETIRNSTKTRLVTTMASPYRYTSKPKATETGLILFRYEITSVCLRYSCFAQLMKFANSSDYDTFVARFNLYFDVDR